MKKINKKVGKPLENPPIDGIKQLHPRNSREQSLDLLIERWGVTLPLSPHQLVVLPSFLEVDVSW